MKTIHWILAASLAGAMLSACGSGDNGPAGGGVTSAATSATTSASPTATGTAGTFLSQVMSIIASGSDTAEPVAVDAIAASTDETANPAPVIESLVAGR